MPMLLYKTHHIIIEFLVKISMFYFFTSIINAKILQIYKFIVNYLLLLLLILINEKNTIYPIILCILCF